MNLERDTGPEQTALDAKQHDATRATETSVGAAAACFWRRRHDAGHRALDGVVLRRRPVRQRAPLEPTGRGIEAKHKGRDAQLRRRVRLGVIEAAPGRAESLIVVGQGLQL